MNIIYSLILLPLLLVGAHIVSLFSSKIRRPLIERYIIFSKIREWKNQSNDADKSAIVIHTASMGEFEHIKPLLGKLKSELDANIIVTFFSPSGYENVKAFPGVDLFVYMPLDFHFAWRKFYRLTKTKILIISKHDVWPNQVKAAKNCGVKSILVNASLGEKSSRNTWMSRKILGPAFRALDKIFVISKEDEERIITSFKCSNTTVTGDTKFDQVLERKEQALKNEILPKKWFQGKTVFVFGSLWPQDAERVLQPMQNVLQKYPNLISIIVPHQPTDETIEAFQSYFKEIETVRYSENSLTDDSRILIVDRVGILADIYKYADIAYVGGSFKQGIHNTMEPATYGIPVIYGPVYKNAYEAKSLLKNKGSLSITTATEFKDSLINLLEDTDLRKTMGEKAKQFSEQNVGGTKQIFDYLRSII